MQLGMQHTKENMVWGSGLGLKLGFSFSEELVAVLI